MKSSSKQANSGELTAAVVAILAIVGITAGVWMWMQKQSALPQEAPAQLAPGEPTPEPTPTPTPTKLFHGKDTYTLSGGMEGKPTISTVTLDPVDPAVSAKQVFSVALTNGSPITDAYLQVRTDTKTTKVPLTLANGASQNGTWTGSWTVPETYLYNYIVTVVATGSNGTTTMPITIRERK